LKTKQNKKLTNKQKGSPITDSAKQNKTKQNKKDLSSTCSSLSILIIDNEV